MEIFLNASKYGNICKPRFIPYQIYKKRVKNFKVTTNTTKSRFTINWGSQFTLFANNFNIKKGKFVLSFCLDRKEHVDVKRI